MQDGDEGEKVVDRLEKESQETSQRVQECRQRRRAIKEELRALAKVVKSLEVKLPKLDLEITGCDTTRLELSKLIPELRLQCEVSEEDIAKRDELSKKVEKCKSDMESCASLAEELENEVAKLQRDIMEAGGPRLKKQKAICAKMMSKLGEAEKSVNSSKVEIVSSEKSLSKARKARRKFEKELTECETSLREKETEFKALEEGALAVMQAYEKVKVIEGEKRSALDSASKEAEELKESQAKSKCVEIDLLGQIDAFEKQTSENRKRKLHWEKEIARLRKLEEESEHDVEEENTYENNESMDIEMGQDAEGASRGQNEMPLSNSVLERFDPEEVKESIATLENERNMLAKNANMGAIAEYRKKEADYLARYALFPDSHSV